MSSDDARLTSEEERLQTQLAAVYNAASNEDLERAYDSWATSYDEDLVQKLHWDAPERTAACLAKHIPKTAKVLDVGCGTGLVGKSLTDLGVTSLDALDLSSAMLESARAKRIYSQLHQMALGPAMALPDSDYDAVIAVGVFTEGHARPDCLPELIRITRPGGCIAFSLRPDVWADLGFREEQERLVAEDRWSLLEETDFQEGFSAVQTRPYKIWVYKVL